VDCQQNNQQDLEREAFTKGVSRATKEQDKAVANARESTTATGRIALGASIYPLVVGLDEWLSKPTGYGRKYKPYFKLMDAELTSLCIAKEVINGISKARKRTAIATAIARGIQSEYQLQTFKKQHKFLFSVRQTQLETEKDYMKERIMLKEMRKRGIMNKVWDTKTQLQVGELALILMEKHTGMITLYTKLENRKRVGMVAPTQEMSEWLKESYKKNALKSFTYEPTINKPRDWTNNFDGGYTLKEFQTRGLFHNSRGKYDTYTREDCPAVFDAVNHLQSTGWKINSQVYDVMTTLWREGSEIAGLPNQEFYDDPPYPLDPTTEAVKNHYQQRQQIRTRNNINIGQRYKVNESLKIAEKYLGYNHIYFPHHVDFRGRVYPTPKFNYQGSDIERGLLMFSEGKPIVNDAQRDAFYIHGANVFGVKGSYSKRLEWVAQEREALLTTAQDPLKDTWWASADKPFQFLAWLLEYADYIHYGISHVSHLPLASDGSCNGLQLMSLLLRDKAMGTSTNCVPLNEPADLYQEIADEVTQRLQSDPTATHLNLLKYGIDRKLMKKAVMSVPYGASYYSIVKIFQDAFYLRFVESGEKSFDGQLRKHASALGAMTWTVLKDKLPNALDLMKRIKDSIKPLIKNNIEVSWVAPSGLRVYQAYPNTVRKRITTAIGQHYRKQTHYRDTLDTLSLKKNLAGIVPNYIHSLDASLMCLVTGCMKEHGVGSLAMIHDSFGTLAYDTPKLAQMLRETAVDIFKNNLLVSFDNDVQEHYPDTQVKGKVFIEHGTLDLNSLTKSLYFFH